jgi:hypothetical protein
MGLAQQLEIRFTLLSLAAVCNLCSTCILPSAHMLKRLAPFEKRFVEHHAAAAAGKVIGFQARPTATNGW